MERTALAVEDFGRNRGEKINSQLRDQWEKARHGPSRSLTQTSEASQTYANSEVGTQETSAQLQHIRNNFNKTIIKIHNNFKVPYILTAKFALRTDINLQMVRTSATAMR